VSRGPVATRRRPTAGRPSARPEGRPYLGTRFRVEIVAADGRVRDLGCCEVILPELPVRRARRDPASEVAGCDRLVLRRGFDGTTDLRRWWQEARRRKAAPARTVSVALLAEDGRTAVAGWVFSGARPVSLAYSPLQANVPAVLLETLVLEYEDVALR
jgi:phage tail-like protein